jgi:hypothetical protein
MHRAATGVIAALLLAFGTLPAQETGSQSAGAPAPGWSISGAGGFARLGGRMADSRFGGFAARVRALRETRLAWGLEVARYDFGDAAWGSRCLDPDCSRVEYFGNIATSALEIAPVLRVGGRAGVLRPYLLTTLGYFRGKDAFTGMPGSPDRTDTVDAVSASAGVGLPVAVRGTARLGLEARYHVFLGSGQGALGSGRFLSVLAVAAFGIR